MFLQKRAGVVAEIWGARHGLVQRQAGYPGVPLELLPTERKTLMFAGKQVCSGGRLIPSISNTPIA
ncbi:hypothetical protein [Burkholderia lata]|uniref:hypothetical protein n=1 Tax=Burkholderia lata (strain ATCC 17760 / DSM 23089 / LMG 22485 / NCIMB 9086 / R18194 / 383) TaxID=482957 RepID=UPI001583F509|nr:hypothetical protein [Burkholderia lata]